MTHDEMIAVIQAHKEGRTVQCKLNASGIVNQELIGRADKLLKERLVASGAATYVKPAYDWSDKTCDLFDFVSYEYRVKPEPPKPREWWIQLPGETDHGEVLHFKPFNENDFILVREVL